MKKEILDLGYEVSQVEDGRVTFIGDAEAICRANIFLYNNKGLQAHSLCHTRAPQVLSLPEGSDPRRHNR